MSPPPSSLSSIPRSIPSAHFLIFILRRDLVILPRIDLNPICRPARVTILLSGSQKHLLFKEKPPCLYLLQEAETGSGEVLETCPFTKRETELSQGGRVGLPKVAGSI